MNFEDLESTWARQLVVGQRISADLVQRALVQEVRHRSRRVRRIIGVAAFVFVVGWGTALVMHYTGIKPFTPLNLAYLFAMTAADAVFFYFGFLTLKRNRDEQSRMGGSLLTAVRGSLRVVERQMRDCRRLAYGAALALCGSVGFMTWKFMAGEFPLRGMVAGTVLDLAFAVGLALTLRRYYQGELRVRREELQRQIEELNT